MLNRNTSAADSVAALCDDPSENVITQPESQVTKFFSTGSTLLNLAMTDNPYYGWPCGRMSNIIGDSSAGKSFLALTGLAEAAHNPEFDDYLIVYDDVEFANTFDIKALFGQRTFDRLQAPRYVNGEARHSRTVEDWYANVMRLLDSGKSFIYVCDSTDALSSAAAIARGMEYVKEQDKNDENEEAGVALAPEVKGSYKTDKPKLFSEALSTIVGGLAATNSCLLMISQTRDSLTPIAFGTGKTRAGGKALKFYATHEMWMLHTGSVKKQSKNIERKIGDMSRIKLTKNKVTGKQREVDIAIYYSYGVDDIGMCLKFLADTKMCDKTTKTISMNYEPRNFSFSGMPETVARNISADADMLMKLRLTVGDVWNSIENDITIERTRKYE